MTSPVSYRTSPFSAHPCGERSYLCTMEDGRAAAMLSADDVRLLASCDSFAPLPRHASAIAAALGAQSREPAVLARLTSLAQTGWLTAEPGILHRCVQRSPVAREEEGIEWLALLTRDRVSCLERAIVSYARNAATHGQRPGLVVIDDSRTSNGAAAARLRALAPGLPLRIHYAGRRERAAFCQRISESGDLPLDVVRFALLGTEEGESHGASRNSILLHTTGYKVLSVDDDTICEPCCGPSHESTSALVVAGDSDATDMWFFADRASLRGDLSARPMDVIGAHAACLGQVPAALAASALARGSSVSMDRACSHIFTALRRGGGRVLLTSNGVAGDSGMHSGELIITKQGPTRRRLFASEDAFCSAITSREMIRHAPEVTLVHAAPVSSMYLGLDNRTLLPPFVPVCRNEDGLFGSMLRSCCPDAFQVQLPWALLHEPPGQRRYARQACGSVRFSDVLDALVRSWSSTALPEAAEARLRSLADYLRQVAAMESGAFTRFLIDSIRRRTFAYLAMKYELLESAPDRPHYWYTEVRRQILTTLQALRTDGYCMPVDLHAGANDMGHVQTLIGKIGGLLHWWPALIETARTLASRGEPLASPLA